MTPMLLAPLLVLATLLLAPPSSPGSADLEKSQRVAATDEPRRFWVKDARRYDSPWYAGERRKMINFGCTRAPYYDPDPRCSNERGFHHGIDLAMPCGT
ncbi:MAG TPA: hypothetical protein VFY11_03170, partial [Nocardioidaceae bacterium]|nr:hypothetical protein [Nocardioidaceae bacterium]